MPVAKAKAKLDLRLAAKGTSVIGTGKDEKGRESAWILGWDGVANRAIHAWFGDEGEHGHAIYEMVDDDDASRARSFPRLRRRMKGTVTLKRTSDDRYTVQWTEVTVDEKEADDLNLVVERLK